MSHRNRRRTLSRSSTPDSINTVNYRQTDDEETIPLLRDVGMADLTTNMAYGIHRALQGNSEQRKRADLILRKTANPNKVHEVFQAQSDKLKNAFMVLANPNVAFYEEEGIQLRLDEISTAFSNSSHAISRKFKRYDGAHSDLGQLVKEVARFSRNGGLTAENVNDLVDQQLYGSILWSFESLRRKFPDPKELLSYFLRFYAIQETAEEYQGRFYSMRFTGRRPIEDETSMLFDAALSAFPKATAAETIDKIRDHVLLMMPDAARQAFLRAEKRYNAIVRAYVGKSELDGPRAFTQLRQNIIKAMS